MCVLVSSTCLYDIIIKNEKILQLHNLVYITRCFVLKQYRMRKYMLGYYNLVLTFYSWWWDIEPKPFDLKSIALITQYLLLIL